MRFPLFLVLAFWSAAFAVWFAALPPWQDQRPTSPASRIDVRCDRIDRDAAEPCFGVYVIETTRS